MAQTTATADAKTDDTKALSKEYVITSGSRVPLAGRARGAGQKLGQWRRTYGRHAKAGLVALCFVVALLGGYGGSLLARGNNDDGITTSSLSDEKKIVTNEGELISQISKNVGPSVVSVNTETSTTSDDFFNYGQTQSQEAAGTGMIIDRSGIILTNRHVVPAGTTSVSVTLADGTTYDNVQVLGRTSSSDSLDVAFLKIKDLKGKTLTPVTLGDSGQAQVGDSVVAIGNALGEFQNTVTSGIISGFGRSVQASADDGSGTFGTTSSSSSEDLDDLIQTDAAINEGNSGGPLVNLNGQVIGINTAIASNAQNIGFSIPINDIKGLITQVLNTGSFSRPYLGVHYVPLTTSIAKQYSISVSSGAYILPKSVSGDDPVVAGSPAEKAGLQGGDVITKVNNDTVTNNQSLTTLLNKYQAGKTVTLTVLRGDKTIKIDATLGTASSS